MTSDSSDALRGVRGKPDEGTKSHDIVDRGILFAIKNKMQLTIKLRNIMITKEKAIGKNNFWRWVYMGNFQIFSRRH